MLMFESIGSASFHMDLKLRSLHRGMFMDTMKSYAIMARKKNIVLTYEDIPESFFNIANRDWVVDVDVCRIEQVVRNFLSNAIKFSVVDGTIDLKLSIVEVEEEEATAEVDVQSSKVSVDVEYNSAATVTRSTAHLLVQVIDQGHGIEEINHAKVFGEVCAYVLYQ